MTSIEYPPRNVPHNVKRFLWSLLAAGVVAFVAELFLESQRAWQAYFVNFLFWSGISQGGVVMAAVYRVTNAHWGEQFRRAGEGMVAFLPISFILFLILIAAGGSLFPWLHEPVHGKEAWLSGPALFGRDALIFGALLWASVRFVIASVRPDLGLLAEQRETASALIARLTRGWLGYDAEAKRSTRRLSRLTPVLLILFTLLYSLIGFDLVMALDPYWYSTIYGWMYCLHAFYAALVAIALLSVISRRWLGTHAAYSMGQWHDMGRFIFGFCLLSGGFFWSQFLVIWYGNLPEETTYFFRRFYSLPWEPLTWVYIILAYLFPLAVFLSARVKQIPGALAAIASLIFVSLFLERFIAVVPFIWHESSIPFGPIELLVTLGFGATFVLSWIWFFERVPLIPARSREEDLVSNSAGIP